MVINEKVLLLEIWMKCITILMNRLHHQFKIHAIRNWKTLKVNSFHKFVCHFGSLLMEIHEIVLVSCEAWWHTLSSQGNAPAPVLHPNRPMISVVLTHVCRWHWCSMTSALLLSQVSLNILLFKTFLSLQKQLATSALNFSKLFTSFFRMPHSLQSLRYKRDCREDSLSALL